MPDIIERNAIAARQLLECAAEIERLRAALAEIIECWKLGGDVFDTVIIAERAIAAMVKQP